VTLKPAGDPHVIWQWLWACRGRLWGQWGRSGRCESEVRIKERWPRLTMPQAGKAGGGGR